MAGPSNIEWTNCTWNPVRGCTRVTTGCGGPNHEGGCYAEKIAARFSDPGQPFHGFAERTQHGGRWTGKVELIEDALTVPLRWKKPRKIFVNSMSDLFHEALPDEAIDRIFAVMAFCPQHTFQVLTKRAERMRAYLTSCCRDGINFRMNEIAPAHWCARELEDYGDLPLRNVWLGVSAEGQPEWDERTEHLRNTPAAIRFVSVEPMLAPIRTGFIRMPTDGDYRGWQGEGPIDYVITKAADDIHWIIDGGESGSDARPYDVAASRDLERQCVRAGVAYFRKQLGAKPFERELSAWPNGHPQGDGSVNAAGDGFGRYFISGLKDRKGGDPDEWPADLRRREFPEVRP